MKLWRALLGGQQEITRYSVDQYAHDLSVAYAGNRYLLGGGGSGWTKTEDIQSSFTGYINSIYKSNGVVFAIVLARMLLFAEARFCWFDIADNGEDGRPAGRKGLEVLERPWPNCSTGELLSRMEQDVSLGGNFYAVREPNRLRRLRPDWLTIVLTAPPAEAVESDVAGYWYHPGRVYSNAGEPTPSDEVYLPDEVAHFSPIPDPDAQYRGMSWLTPGVREVMADKAATDHKLAFFENGAQLGVIISAKENLTNAQYKEWKENFSNLHTGTSNAYKSLFLASPVDTSVTTADMRQLDFKVTQGAGETRLCSMGGVPPIIVGLSEGLQSATYSNYGMARRKFGDGWAHPQWKMASTALSNVVEAPNSDVRLGVNTRGIAFLREDAKDLAEIIQIQASAVNTFITAGYKPDSAAAAVEANDLSLLEHTGLTSVQLQPPGSQDLNGDGTPDAAAAAADEYQQALDEFRAELEPHWDEIDRRRPYPGQRWKHGWIPLFGKTPTAPSASPEPTKPTSMSDLDIELHGLHGADRRSRMLDLGYSPDEVFQTLGREDRPTSMSDLAYELRDVEPSRRGDVLLAWGYTFDEIAQLLGAHRSAGPDDDDIERSYYDVRIDAGHKGGGRFRKLGDIAAELLTDWLNGKGDKEDPLEQFTTTAQLRKIAEQHGIAVKPRMSVPALKLAILDDAKARFRVAKAAKSPEVGKPVRFTLAGGSVDPTKVREVEVENRIRAAYRDLARSPGSHVMLADLRERSGVPRADFDATLVRLSTEGGQLATVHLAPEEDRRRHTPRLRDAAIRHGDEDMHSVAFEDPSPRPVPKLDSKLRNLDVGVFTEGGKVSLWEVSDSGQRRKRVAVVGDLAGLESWATEHGESELAGWARKERGGTSVPSAKPGRRGGGGPAEGADALAAAPASLVTGRGLTTAQKSALRNYQQQGAHDRINTALRQNRDVSKLAQVARIDEAMAGSKLTDDVVVYRGVPGRLTFGDNFSGDLTGFEWTDRAYLSTSAQKDWAAGFGHGGSTDDEGATVLRVVAPQGTPAIQMSRFEQPNGRPDEAELLIDRGLRLRVVADRREERGKNLLGIQLPPHRVLDVEVVPGKPNAETKARALQVENDHGRAVAEALTQVDELVHNGASDKALRHRIEHLPGTPEPLRKELLAAVGDPFDARAGRAESGGAALAATAPRRKLTSTQTDALEQYGIDTSFNINAALREGKGDLSKLRRPEKHRPIVAALDSAMEPATSDVVLYRRVHGGDVFAGDHLAGDLTGKSFTDYGFLSTSTTERRGSTMVMRILAPKGTPAVSGSHLEKDEVVLGRGLTYRVVADHGAPGGTIRQIDVEVVPKASPPLGDRSKLAQVADKAAKDAGLTPVGKAGDTARYDRSLHEPMGGEHFPDGSPVVVARQGYKLRRSDGSTVTVSRPVVMPAGEEAAPSAKANPGIVAADAETKDITKRLQSGEIDAAEAARLLGEHGRRRQAAEDAAAGRDQPGNVFNLADMGPAKATKAAKKAAPAAQPTDLSRLRTLDREVARDELDLRKVDDLKALLKAEGLPVSGKKRELVDRLVEHLGGQSAHAQPPLARWTEPKKGEAALSAPPKDLAKMADDPRAAALWYRSGDNSLETGTGRPGAFDMADQLRARKLDPEMKKRVADIDSVMKESVLSGPIEVYRGVDFANIFRNWENVVGKQFTDRNFVSTTTDADHSSWFGGTVMRIRVPAGTKAIRMADRAGVERDAKESEILLDRNLRFRIVRQYERGELKGPWGGARVVDVEVVQ